MTLNVNVALVANTAHPFESGPIDPRYYDEPYDQRRRVALSVDEGESLASVLRRAAETLGLQPPAGHWTGGFLDTAHRKVAFYRPEDDAGIVERPQGRMMLYELTLVDREGRAVFGVHDLRAVTYADLLRAAAAGTLDGDPLKPYLILDDGWGDVPPVDWATLAEGLDIAWDVVKVVAVATGAATGAAKATKWLRERLERGRAAARGNPEWSQRGYRPDQFITLMSIRDWDAASLGSLLGCSPQEAEAILWTLGYAHDEAQGAWRYEGDEAAQMLVNIRAAIQWAAHRGGDWQPRVRAWLVRYLETGEAPPFEMLDLPGPGEPFPEYRPTVGERIDGLLARLSRGPGQ